MNTSPPLTKSSEGFVTGRGVRVGGLLHSTFQKRTWLSRFGFFSLFRTLWHRLIPWSLYVNAVNGGELRCAAAVLLTGSASLRGRLQRQQQLFHGQAPFTTAARTLFCFPLSTLAPLLHPRHDVRCHRDGRVGAQLPADAAEAGRTGVRLLSALPGCWSRDEPGVGDC